MIAATIPNLSALDAVLSAAAELPAEFTAEDVTVASWKRFPARFALRGYPDFPDKNSVVVTLAGARGLVARGYLSRPRPGVYALTAAGKRRALVLAGQDPGPAPPEPDPPALAGAAADALERLLAAPAWGKFRAGAKAAVTFADASAFWRLGREDFGPKVDARLGELGSILAAVADELPAAGAVLPSGRLVRPGDVRALYNAHDWMRDRFDKLLNLLRGRK